MDIDAGEIVASKAGLYRAYAKIIILKIARSKIFIEKANGPKGGFVKESAKENKAVREDRGRGIEHINKICIGVKRGDAIVFWKSKVLWA